MSFVKQGDVEVTGVRKACPHCGSQIIEVSAYACESCKLDQASIPAPEIPDSEEKENAL